MKLTLKYLIAGLVCFVGLPMPTALAQTMSPSGLPTQAESNSRLARWAPAEADAAEPIPRGAEFGETPTPDTAAPGPLAGPYPIEQSLAGPPPCPPPSTMTDSCHVYFGRGSCCPPEWYVDQGVRLLVRGKPRIVPMGRQFVVSPANPFNPSLFFPLVIDSRSVNYEAQAGYTLTVGYHLGHDVENRDDYCEFTYWGLNHWNESYAVNGERLTLGTLTFGNLFSFFQPSLGVFDTAVPGFNRADEMRVESRSEIHNLEWNLRVIPRGRPDRLVLHPDGRWEREVPRGCQMQYLIGLRYLTFDESFRFAARGRIEQNGLTIANPTGDYQSFTTNDMLGLQVGAEMHWQRPRWGCGVRVKAGPYINWAEQSSFCRTTGGGDDPFSNGLDLDFETRGQNSKTAFIGEVGLFANYKVRKNFTLHASYDLFWVSGLALAPEQQRFETDPADHIASLTTLLFQGMSLRAEFLW